MRNFIEPSMRNLLRRPLVLGVPVQGLLALSGATLSLSIMIGSEPRGNALTVGLGLSGYIALRVAQRFSKPGWEDTLFFPIEFWFARKSKPKTPAISVQLAALQEVFSPDTATESDLLTHKDGLSECFAALKVNETAIYRARSTRSGLHLNTLTWTNEPQKALQ